MSLSKPLPTSTVASLPSSASLPPPAPLYEWEFRNPDDDAWYSVHTVLDGQKLIVKYQNFTDDDDLVLSPDRFRSCEDLLSLRYRFRSISAQLQDKECCSLASNAVLCTSHSFPSSAVLFYDAVLEQVIHKKHRFENGEERCLCKFMVVWKHGPLAGCLAVKGVEDLCLVDPNPWLDDNVESFIHRATEKLGIPAMDKNLLLPSKGGDAGSPSGTKAGFAQRFRLKRTKCARRSLPLGDLLQVEEAERPASCLEKSREDSDIGGSDSHFVMLIENLQKDLSPSAIEEFIHRQTSIAVKAYVYPSMALETYTKAAIVLECQRDLEKLCQFLDSPNHIIMSQKGRPWVVSGILSGCNAFTGPIQSLIFKYQNNLPHKGIRTDEELKLVPSGSEEYAAAKQLRDLFVEFIEHQRGLHRRLAMEEEKVLQPSM